MGKYLCGICGFEHDIKPCPCLAIMKYNQTRPFQHHNIMFHHNKVARSRCKNNNAYAFQHNGEKSTIFLDIRTIMDDFGMDYFDHIVHILSHELMHEALYNLEGRYCSIMFDRMWLQAIITNYLGGTPHGVYESKIDKFIRDYKQKQV